jgi:hypothetical protein
VGQGFALRESSRLGCDPVVRLEHSRELGVQTHPLLLRQLRCAVQARLGGPRQRHDLLPHLQQLRLGLAHQRHKHFTHPPTLAAKAAHNLREGMLELLCLCL